MVTECKSNRIDVALFQETTCKWNTYTLANIKRKFRQVHPNAWLNGSDSKENRDRQSTWLPGGTLSIMWGEYVNEIKIGTEYSDEMVRWFIIL